MSRVVCCVARRQGRDLVVVALHPSVVRAPAALALLRRPGLVRPARSPLFSAALPCQVRPAPDFSPYVLFFILYLSYCLLFLVDINLVLYGLHDACGEAALLALLRTGPPRSNLVSRSIYAD